MIAIYGEIRAIETGEADRLDNVLKKAPHTAEDLLSAPVQSVQHPTLEVGIHVPVHFHDFAARGLVDKIVPDDVRPIVVIRVPDLAQEFIQSGVHTILFDCRVYLDVATGLLPVDPE